jgi:hypothetical protein
MTLQTSNWCRYIQGDSGGVTVTYGAHFWRHFEQKVAVTPPESPCILMELLYWRMLLHSGLFAGRHWRAENWYTVTQLSKSDVWDTNIENYRSWQHAPFSLELFFLKTRNYQLDKHEQRMGRLVSEPVVSVNLQTICSLVMGNSCVALWLQMSCHQAEIMFIHWYMRNLAVIDLL